MRFEFNFDENVLDLFYLFDIRHSITIFYFQYRFTAVTQFYITEAENEYVIKGNSAVMKCKIPSFVADFIFVEAWIDEDGIELTYNLDDKFGINNLLLSWTIIVQ